MRELCFFDALTFLALLAAFFTVGIHLGKPKVEDTVYQAEITVKLFRSKIPDSIEDVDLKIDGKYKCSLSRLEDDSLSLYVDGSCKEAGFLTSGAKYLSKNQPLEILGEGAYFYGRITRIEARVDTNG